MKDFDREWSEKAPTREWSPDARALINVVYQFWADNHRPPNYLDLHQATGISPRRARRLFRELQEGFALKAQDQIVGLSIEKAPPFSATPTTIAAFDGDEFISYVGCPMEGMTVGPLPPFEDTTLTLRSFCACCAEPIELKVRRQEVLSANPSEPLVAVVRSPWDWEGGVTSDIVCDSFHYVLDREHAARFERRIGRRGTTMTLAQVAEMTGGIAAGRMKDPHYPQIRIEAQPLVDYLTNLGVDFSVWAE